METAREALEKAQKTFSHYAGLHKLKGTIEGDNKARKNAELADEMHRALAALSTPSVSDTVNAGLVEALKKAIPFVRWFRTEESAELADEMQKLADAPSRGEAAGCVMADEPGKCVNPACREDGACVRSHHPEAGAPSREAITRAIIDNLRVGYDHIADAPVLHDLDKTADAILSLFPTPPDKAVLGVKGEREGVAEQLRVEAGHAKPGFGRLLLKAAQLLSERPAAEGWRKHDGTTQPVADHSIVDIEFSDGSVEHRTSAGNWEWNDQLSAPQVVRWRPSPSPANPALPQDVETKEGGVS